MNQRHDPKRAIAWQPGHTENKFSRGDFMWCRLKNFVRSVQTYRDLSPDLGLRRQVNRQLRDRPIRTPTEWCDLCCQSIEVSRAIAQFAYEHLPRYSGLNFAYVLPSDRLEELRWTEVCGFDWQLHLCEDIQQQFQVDLSDRLDQIPTGTVADLLLFLQQQVCGCVGQS